MNNVLIDEIREILLNSLDEDKYEDIRLLTSKLEPHVNFISDLGIDSLDLMEFFLRFEDSFGIKVDPADYQRFPSLRAVAELAERGRRTMT